MEGPPAKAVGPLPAAAIGPNVSVPAAFPLLLLLLFVDDVIRGYGKLGEGLRLERAPGGGWVEK